MFARFQIKPVSSLSYVRFSGCVLFMIYKDLLLLFFVLTIDYIIYWKLFDEIA